jgi:microcystin-dependent protein
LTAKPIRTATGVSAVNGMLVAGTPYQLVYSNSNNEFILLGFGGNPYQIPLGGMIDYIGTTAPHTSYALPFGQAISRSTYAGLFALVGTNFGGGNGSTTFNLPDCRGRVVAGYDSMGGSAANRLSTFSITNGPGGTQFGGAGGAESVTVLQANLPSVALSMVDPTITVSDTRTWQGSKAASSAGVLGASDALQQPNGTNNSITIPVSVTSGSITASINNPDIALGGSGIALNKMPPTIVLSKIIRIL